MLKASFVFFIIPFIISGGGAWIIYRYGDRIGLLDEPNERSSHYWPTPKGGGIGILTAFLFASFFVQIPPTFWVSATFLALLSFIGDKYHFSPKLRLPLHFIAAIAFIVGRKPFLLDHLNGVLVIICYVVFIVGTTNWYNFMDGINGIAAITGIVGFSLLALSNISSEGDPLYTILSICISLSCLGFLPFNLPNAKIFMGDVGSILLGFVFAAMVVVLSRNFLDFVCLAAFLFPFYADELTTMAIRINDGENLLYPHRRHLYQLLANEKKNRTLESFYRIWHITTPDRVKCSWNKTFWIIICIRSVSPLLCCICLYKLLYTKKNRLFRYTTHYSLRSALRIFSISSG